ncbi:MAG TPA: GNAT family N-acetyltransferase [Rhizobiaceae bacterium]|nr:GNAT family N-acetyltransferase [Rhizobiaceae bacterium]
MPSRSRYSFRAVEADDLPMLGEWLKQPHLVEWWGDPAEAIAEIKEAMDDIATEPLIVELDGTPIAYLQSYDPHLEDDHPYQDQPTGTLGIDVSIGDPDLIGKGHGSAIIRDFVDQLFAEGAPRVVIDPDPANKRAIRAYEKAGFTAFDTRTSIYGPALMMKRDAPEESRP